MGEDRQPNLIADPGYSAISDFLIDHVCLEGRGRWHQPKVTPASSKSIPCFSRLLALLAGSNSNIMSYCTSRKGIIQYKLRQYYGTSTGASAASNPLRTAGTRYVATLSKARDRVVHQLPLVENITSLLLGAEGRTGQRLFSGALRPRGRGSFVSQAS